MNTQTGSGLRGFGALKPPAEKPADIKQNTNDSAENEPLKDKQGEPLKTPGDDGVGVSADKRIASESQIKAAAALFTSHPIMRLKLGKFQFDKGLLTLEDSEEASKFRAMVDKLPARDKNQIREISVEAAERLVRPIEPGVTTQFDSSVGRQREKTGTGDDVVGTEPLEGTNREQFSKGAQLDANAPTGGTVDKQVVTPENGGVVQTPEQIEEQRKIADQSQG